MNRRRFVSVSAIAAAVRGEEPLTISFDEELLVAETILRACGTE
jgi:acid phosphatase class B